MYCYNGTMSITSAASISDSLEQQMADGRLAPGDRLVPVRELADHLGVSPATVQAAYRRLRELGVVVGRGRQGTIVAPRVQPASSQLVTVPPGAIDALRGSPDPTLLPDLTQAFKAALSQPQASYGDRLISTALNTAARDHFAEDDIDAEFVTVTSGSMDAIERVIAAAGLRRGARIGVEDPGHVPVHQLVRSAGMELVPLPLDVEGITPAALAEALDHGLDALIVTPRCQNPTGAAFTAARAKELSEVISSSPELLVIHDDHAGQISAVPFHGLTVPGPRHATIRSLGKAYGPDLRLAIMASDRQTHERVSLSISNGPGWVSHLLQRAAAFLLTDETAQATVRAAAREYTRRRELLITALAEQGIAATGRSGFNVWLPVVDEQATVEAARAAGYAIRAADTYRIESEPAVRLTVSNLDDDKIHGLASALGSNDSQADHGPMM